MESNNPKKPSSSSSSSGVPHRAQSSAGAQPIGACYGMKGRNKPRPAKVIELYKSKEIRRMRLYEPTMGILEELSKTNIELILGVPNSDLINLSDSAKAKTWVKRHVTYYKNVKFRYIAVGSIEKNVDDAKRKLVPDAMKNIFGELESAGLQSKIKVSTAIDTAVLLPNPIDKPSEGTFNPNIQSFLHPILKFLFEKESPLLVNVNTYFHYINIDPNPSLHYALFSPTSFVVKDGTHEYKNLYHAILDTLYSALEKTKDWPSLKETKDWEIVVSTGWPSAGGNYASKANAKKYNQNLITHVKALGTPKKPVKAIETYVFTMFNENNENPDGYENHFGLFQPDLKPVYELNFP